MTDKFTPGPWQMSGARQRINGSNTTFHVIGPDAVGWIAAVPYSDKTPEEHTASLADAHLIAAAPDMAGALEAVLDLVKTDAKFGMNDAVMAQTLREFVSEKILPIMAKARGES